MPNKLLLPVRLGRAASEIFVMMPQPFIAAIPRLDQPRAVARSMGHLVLMAAIMSALALIVALATPRDDFWLLAFALLRANGLVLIACVSCAAAVVVMTQDGLLAERPAGVAVAYAAMAQMVIFSLPLLTDNDDIIEWSSVIQLMGVVLAPLQAAALYVAFGVAPPSRLRLRLLGNSIMWGVLVWVLLSLLSWAAGLDMHYFGPARAWLQ
ncbi:MAG TPA: hypothetical protein VGO52_08725 [Hyphomonadaceae bacterium]|jgi:hypothetical protein|nr:hypothetical protein [Hyphomonadaceae bacterium]